MKIQKYFEASTETTPAKEIAEMVLNYDLNRTIQDIIENEPTRNLKVTYNVTIEY